MAGSSNKGCLVVVIATFVLDALIAVTVILFANGDWRWATGITCFIAAIFIIGAVIIRRRSLNYCPECGKKFSLVLKGRGGSKHKKCLNPECKLNSQG